MSAVVIFPSSKSDTVRGSVRTFGGSTTLAGMSLSASNESVSHSGYPLPDYEVLQQLFMERRQMFHTVPGKGAWSALRRCILPVQFQDEALEAAYQHWQFVSTHTIEKNYHFLAVILILFGTLHQLTVPGGVWLYTAMAATLACVLASALLVWRRARSTTTSKIVIGLDVAAFLIFLTHTSVCNEWLYSAQCGTLKTGLVAGAHLISCFVCMLLLTFGLNLQVHALFGIINLYFAVWITISVSQFQMQVAGLALMIGCLYVVLAVVCTQAYQRHVSNRMQFHMLLESSQQIQDKHQAMKDLEVAHQEALGAQEKAVRATTTRNIHESIMGYTCHQLRNPLHSLRGIMEHLRKRCCVGHPIDATDIENLQLIEDAATQLSKVADDVLDFQKLQNGTFTHKPAVADVRTVIEAAVRPIRDNCPVPIQVDVDEHVPLTLYADGAHVTQMLHIGLSNATKFQKPNTAVQVRCQLVLDDLPALRFEVWNEGQGLGTVDVQMLFEPYERSMQEGQLIRGLGLGLPISLLLSRLLGGQVGLEDRGRHTVYWFTIPAAGQAMPSPTVKFSSSRGLLLPNTDSPRSPSPLLMSTPRTAASGGSVDVQITPELTPERPWTYWGRAPGNLSSPLNVMVVDDLRTNRRLLLAMLSRLGHQVAELEDGDELANDLHEGRCIDVLMLDIHMVRSDGRDVARFLREQGHMFPIIAVTGNVASSDMASYVDAGFDGVLGKPFTSQHVAALLKEIMHANV